MASSENQGLQIALIIFVMLTIILSVTTFVFFQQYEEAEARSVADRDAAGKAEQTLRSAETELMEMKKMIGLAETAKHEEAKTAYTDDMKLYGATIPEDKRFYRQALQYASTTLNSINEQLVEARNTIQSLKDSNQAFETAKQQQLATAEAAQKQAQEALAAAQAAFSAEIENKNQVNSELAANLEAKNQEMAAATEKFARETEALTKDNQKLGVMLEAANEKIDVIDPSKVFEVADGEIRWVDQTSGSVWINVGQSDGLRRRVTFSVLGSDQAVGGDQQSKASIEVTDVLGPHFARARIVDDSLSNPIVQGDKIFSPLWEAGRGEHFAIAGDIDLDNDGVDDRPIVHDLISMAGGTIDAELDKEGKQTGEMTLHTRYLVIGEPPADESLEGWTQILEEAERLGVHQITVEKFLDHIGFKDPKQVLRFGRKGNAGTMTGDDRDGGRPVAAGRTSEIFKKRRPPGQRESAY